MSTTNPLDVIEVASPPDAPPSAIRLGDRIADTPDGGEIGQDSPPFVYGPSEELLIVTAGMFRRVLR